MAALAPAGALAAAHGGGAGGSWDPLHAIADWLHGRAAAATVRSQELIELATTHKLAAAAATAALAGGGVATVETTVLAPPKRSHVHRVQVHAPPRVKPAPVAVYAPEARHRPHPARHARHRPSRVHAAAPVEQPAAPAQPAQPAPALASKPAPAAPKHAATGSGGGEFGP